jgi:hypothetical protein
MSLTFIKPTEDIPPTEYLQIASFAGGPQNDSDPLAQAGPSDIPGATRMDDRIFPDRP